MVLHLNNKVKTFLLLFLITGAFIVYFVIRENSFEAQLNHTIEYYIDKNEKLFSYKENIIIIIHEEKLTDKFSLYRLSAGYCNLNNFDLPSKIEKINNYYVVFFLNDLKDSNLKIKFKELYKMNFDGGISDFAEWQIIVFKKGVRKYIYKVIRDCSYMPTKQLIRQNKIKIN